MRMLEEVDEVAFIEPPEELYGELVNGVIILPNNYLDANLAAENIFSILSKAKKLFYRGGLLVEAVKEEGEWTLSDVNVDKFRSRLSRGGRKVYHYVVGRNSLDLRLKACSADTAKVLMNTEAVRDNLPHIQMVVESPIVVDDGEVIKVLAKGYNHERGGVFVANGAEITEVSLDNAVSDLKNLLRDYQFQKSGDRSRAIASMITPSMRMGGMIKDPTPLEFTEADKSQAGKTTLHKAVRSIYGLSPYLILKRTGGVGSLDESIQSGLLTGKPFLVFDNFRGRFDSQTFEGLMTKGKDAVNVRVPHKGEIPVFGNHITFQMTSNGVELTPDLANRTSMVRIRKREGYEFTKWPEGDLIDHITENQSHYFGCVVAVLKEWKHQGSQKTDEIRHDFRDWARKLDWIIQNIFNEAPLMDDHQKAIARQSNPVEGWLRKVAIEVNNEGMEGKDLSASELYELCETSDIDYPKGKTYSESQGPIQIGRMMGKLFGKDQQIEIDHYTIRRNIYENAYDASKETKKYLFRSV